MVQTHASLVFLAGSKVYKIKKAVNFGFLDFSSLGARQLDCEREVRLNQRLAPDVYEGVVPIVRDAHGLRWGAAGPGGEASTRSGTIVEYAVVMRRLDEEGFLDRMLTDGRLKREHLKRVAELLTRFYRGQRSSAALARWGEVSRLKVSTRENFRQVRPFVGRTLSSLARVELERMTRDFFRTHEALFRERVRQGRILDCHGDLHLEHIHFAKRGGVISIYDCIEFNERFRFVDVASDVAFVGMDLDYRGRPDLARYWMQTMSKRLGDRGILELNRFYASYRAVVRGKVESFHSEAAQASEEERRESGVRAGRYFQLAMRYAVTGVDPCVWVVMGGIGSGKSTVARGLHRELGWVSGSSDVYRKQLAGLPLLERTPERMRAEIYSREMTRETYARLEELAELEVRAGRQVILDATYGKVEARVSLLKRAARWKVPVRFLELRASARQVKERLKSRERRGGEVSDARLEDWAALKTRYEPPIELPRGVLRRVTSGSDEEKTLKRVIRIMREWVESGSNEG